MSAPLIKYRTGWFSNSIEKVECSRETNAFVYVLKRHRGQTNERREAKTSQHAQYHDSWEDAKEYLRSKAEDVRDNAASALEIAEAKLAEFSAMKPPRGAA